MRMEGISFSGGLKKYWRRGYKRLHVSDRRKRETVQLGQRRRTRWRSIRIAPKMRIFPKVSSSPKKLVLWVRDAYVRMMLGLANSMAPSAVGYGGDPVSVVKGGFDWAPPPKEYDHNIILSIYNSFLVAPATPKVTTKMF